MGDSLRLECSRLAATAWREATAGLAGSSLPQSAAFGAAKARVGPWRVEHAVLRRGSDVVGAAQVLLRPAPAGLPSGLAWINRAPLWRTDDEEDPATYAAMLQALKRHYGDQRGLYLRLAPPFAADHPLAAALAPDPGSGLVVTATPGWASARVALIVDEDALRAGLAQKWRNVLNKAERSGIAVEAGGGEGDVATFCEAYGRFLDARGFATSVTPGLLRDLLGEGASLAVLRATGEAGFLGSLLIANYGDTAEYLAGVVEDAGRAAGAGQLLLLRALFGAKAAGRRWFDLGGLDPDATPDGIRRFKEGLGGTAYRLAPEMDAAGSILSRLVRWRVVRARAAL